MCSCKGLAVVVLVLVNFVFAAAGLLMLAFGIAAASKPESVVEILSYAGNLSQQAEQAGFDLASIIKSSAVFLIVMGVVVALVGLFGCVGACCKVKWMLGVYITVLIIILLGEIALIIFAALFPEKFKEESQPAMLKTLQLKFKNDVMISSNNTIVMPNGETELAWTSMQFEVGCCGAFGYRDYTSVNFTRSQPSATVPVSCCKLKDGPGRIPTMRSEFVDLDDCLGGSPKMTSINEQDCYTALEMLLKQYGRIGIGIAAGIIGVEVILILLAAWICRSIDHTKSQTI